MNQGQKTDPAAIGPVFCFPWRIVLKKSHIDGSFVTYIIKGCHGHDIFDFTILFMMFNIYDFIQLNNYVINLFCVLWT